MPFNYSAKKETILLLQKFFDELIENAFLRDVKTNGGGSTRISIIDDSQVFFLINLYIYLILN